MAVKGVTKMSDVSGDSMWYPQEDGFKPTFWGSGWNQVEETMSPGAMETERGSGSKARPSRMGSDMGVGKGGGMLATNKMRKMGGKCPFCG